MTSWLDPVAGAAIRREDSRVDADLSHRGRGRSLGSSLRIAIVAACPFPLSRGTPLRILRMSEALAERGHEVHVATYHLGAGDVAPAVHVHRISNLRFYQRLSPGPSYRKLLFVDPLLVGRLRRLLDAMPFDVIHAHHYEGLLVAAVSRGARKIPLVYDAHTLLTSELPFYPLGLPQAMKRSLGDWMDRHVPRLAGHTVCVTEMIRDRLVRSAGIDADKVSVITSGVEVEHFDPDAQAYTKRNGGRTIIFTGNLTEYQGIDLLLKAFAEVAARVADARLLIATNSSFEPYEALAQELGIRRRLDVIASPEFKDLPALLARADVAVNPRTKCDGIPAKLLNYMAAARPIVSFASSAPGMVHGQSGWLVEGADVSALARGIVTLLEDQELARRLGRAARSHVQQNCRWPVVAERCERLYRAMIDSAP